jgi:DNA (cytosine-5)-methyltransferase 1
VNYYNDNDPFCCDWLRNLIKAGLIPDGDVDQRSIKEVQANELRKYRQCHFFAGIGAVPEGLWLAGFHPDRELWTASPPCQDNSLAAAIHGKRSGLRGVRSGLAHVWLDLVEQCLPCRILFENVPGVKKWLPEVTGRLESAGYRVAVRDLPASRAGAPHQRRRVWLAAHRDGPGLEVAGEAGPPQAGPQQWPAPYRGVWEKRDPDTGSLDDGAQSRVAKVRAIGNAVCPQAAAEFIRACLIN